MPCMDSTSEPIARLDVKGAVATLDRALAYAGPLQRRTEGITWILFGLSVALLAVTSAWISETGRDPHYRWFALAIAGFALLGFGVPLLSWRIAGAVKSDYVVDARRVVAGILVLAVFLITANWAVWTLFNEYYRLSVALLAALFGGSSWALLGLSHWSRMTQRGRRDTLLLGAVMVLSAVLLYAFVAEVDSVGPRTLVATVVFSAIPVASGIWRLVRN